MLLGSFLALSLSCDDPDGAQRASVVYGGDDRTEIYAHANPALVAIAESAIAMKIGARHVDESVPSNVRITYTRTLSEAQDLCPGEPFEDQIDPGTCSGTLIDDQHIVTAGHCMDAGDDCADSVWLFDFRYEADGVLSTLTSDDVYRCAGVLAYFDDDRVDHAVVRLDRPVVGHRPAPVRIEPAGLAPGTPLALIGHPNGIPMKIDSGGVVTTNSGDLLSLRGTVDAFNGNSGSGVFDHTGMLVAVLRGGETDYVDNGGCNIVNVIDPAPTDDGESLVYVRRPVELYCDTPGVESVLCTCSGPCVPALAGDTCLNAEPIESVDQDLSGSLAGYAPDSEGECGGLGPDRAFSFTLTSTTFFTARSSGFDSVLYLRQGCDPPEVACHDDIDRDNDRGSRIEAELPPGDYTLFLDAYGLNVSPYLLRLRFDDPAVSDAGTPLQDAGSMSDSGTTVADAGTMPPLDMGCACAIHARSNDPQYAFAALFGISVFLRRRRRDNR